MDARDWEQIYRTCTRFLRGHYPQSLRQQLEELAAYTDPSLTPDFYGKGDLIQQFEAEVASILGKEAAVFMPSGTMCQQIALRIWTDRTGIPLVAFHPTCHLEIHEEQGYRHLHRLHGIGVGSPYRLMTLADLQNVREPLGALLLELPQREIGGQLPTWEELTAIIAWARERNIPTHIDGARLWECKPFYQRSYAEIAALFDTVYVSLYKILGGIAGSMLAGPKDIISSARIWQRRHGGNLVSMYPYILAAQKGLHERLDRIDQYCAKARAIAAALTPLPRIEVDPNPPHTNMMQVFLRGDLNRLWEAALDIARETGVWLIFRLAPSQIPAYQKLEISVGDATLDLSEDEIVRLFQVLFEKADAHRNAR